MTEPIVNCWACYTLCYLFLKVEETTKLIQIKLLLLSQFLRDAVIIYTLIRSTSQWWLVGTSTAVSKKLSMIINDIFLINLTQWRVVFRSGNTAFPFLVRSSSTLWAKTSMTKPSISKAHIRNRTSSEIATRSVMLMALFSNCVFASQVYRPIQSMVSSFQVILEVRSPQHHKSTIF